MAIFINRKPTEGKKLYTYLNLQVFCCMVKGKNFFILNFMTKSNYLYTSTIKSFFCNGIAFERQLRSKTHGCNFNSLLHRKERHCLLRTPMIRCQEILEL